MAADLLIARETGWEQRLVAFVARERQTPFAWGEHDCATLALGVVTALTGVDLARGVPRWFSPASALRSLRHAGAKSAAEFFAARLPEIPVAEAHRGDLVLPAPPLDRLACPAILVGAAAMSRNEAGWVVMPRELAARAFRVG